MATRTVYIIQQEAGDDGLYHWKLFVAKPGSQTAGTWHDVVWSSDKDVGMEHRGPKEFSEAKSRGTKGLHKIGDIKATDAARVDQVCAITKTPQYTVEDKDKNCQTWVYDVVRTLVKEKVLAAGAIALLDKVPKEED